MSFPSVQDAIGTVVGILQSAIPIARVEFLDKISMKMCNLYSKTDYDENPTCFLEFHGSASSVQEQIELVKEIAIENKGFIMWNLLKLKLNNSKIILQLHSGKLNHEKTHFLSHF